MTNKYPGAGLAMRRYQPKELYPVANHKSLRLVVLRFVFLCLVIGFVFCLGSFISLLKALHYGAILVEPGAKKYTNLLLFVDRSSHCFATFLGSEDWDGMEG